MAYSPFAKTAPDGGGQLQASTQVSPVPEQLVPASSQVSSAASSRNPSPTPPASRRASTNAVTFHLPSETAVLEPSVLHSKAGGAAWSLDMPWVKTSGGDGSKRGSRIGSAAGSRKASFTGGDSRKASFTTPDSKSILTRGLLHGHGQQHGHETTQQIWATHDALDSSRSGGGLSHRSYEKEHQESSMERLSEPHKRLSLPRPFLRAHTTEQKIGFTVNSKYNTMPQHKTKRASVPPMQIKKGGLALAGTVMANGSGAGGESNSRRGSLSGGPARLGVTRNRSQSLPSDSLFLAYSSCALPAVMTSSLAAMPIPSQPAIPVSVARRYSILSPPDKLDNTTDHCKSLTNSQEKFDLEESVNVDPANVEGIDTQSVLDTSHLQDMASDDDDDAATRARVASSTQVTPSASPVGSSTQASPLSYPVSMTSSLIGAGSVSRLGGPLGRSRSVIHTVHRPSGMSFALPSRDQQETTPDYTPMPSPTNLSAAVFKQTLATRRMSEVVAKDITNKLRVLKKHMKQDASHGETQEASSPLAAE